MPQRAEIEGEPDGWILAIHALLAGDNYTDAAAKAGVTRQTLYNWRQDPGFRKAREREKKLLHEKTRDRLSTLGSKALDTLEDLLDHGDVRDDIRHSAAKTVLGHLLGNRLLHEGPDDAAGGRSVFEDLPDLDLSALVAELRAARGGKPIDVTGEDDDY